MKSTETNNRAQSFWGLLALLLVLLPGLMFGQSAKMSHELNSLSGAESVDVIVQYHKVPTQTHFDRVHFRGGSLNRDLHHVKAGAFRVPAARLAELSNDPDVKFISLDRPVRATSTSSTPDLYAQAVLAQAAQGQYDGTGIGIAVIDSGITSNADFGTRVVYSQNFVVGQLSADDGYGHGTHIAGIAAGNGANSTGANFSKTFTGIASKANLINLRVLDQNGSATDSAVIAAIQTAIQLKSTYNIKVINLSLGRGVYESYTLDPLCQAVESA